MLAAFLILLLLLGALTFAKLTWWVLYTYVLVPLYWWHKININPSPPQPGPTKEEMLERMGR